MNKQETIKKITEKYQIMNDVLNERTRRLWVATEAKAIGRGGPSILHKVTNVDFKTIQQGLKEISGEVDVADNNRIRRHGGGRKKLTEKYPDLLDALDKIIDPTKRGDPESSLRWTTKSTRKIEEDLNKQGYKISQHAVHSLLVEEGYSLQSNKKTREGTDHEDRDAQFEYISKSVEEMQKNTQPVISVDTKKKENIGNFKNDGREWEKEKEPLEVNMHDFPDKELGKVIPYGIYDIQNNKGWVTLGIDHDTASFAVESIKGWWIQMGKKKFKKAKSIMITADCGGSNGYKNRLWKKELQEFANKFKITIHVRHFPPGTSKWNKIEHRLFSFITKNWRGRPLLSKSTVINLISNTTTKTGLKVKAVLDENKYETGIKVTDEEFESINLIPEEFHGEWNYTIKPN